MMKRLRAAAGVRVPLAILVLYVLVAIFAPLIAATLVLGVYPSAVFNLTQASVDHMVSAYQAAIGG